MTQRRKADALRFIAGFLEANGFGPSRREIGAAIGLKGMETVQSIVDELVDDGAVRTLPGKHRAIELLRQVDIPRAPDGAPLFFARPGERI